MGNGGGDPKAACENTFEATEAGLKSGMNAVRLDVSMSTEGILFLWRDHLPGEKAFIRKLFKVECQNILNQHDNKSYDGIFHS